MSENMNQALNEGSSFKFISNKPLGTDLFEGKSQEKTAEKISDLLLQSDYCKVIGIDGAWGSGKSNLIQFKNPPPLVVVMFFGAMPKFDNFAK